MCHPLIKEEGSGLERLLGVDWNLIVTIHQDYIVVGGMLGLLVSSTIDEEVDRSQTLDPDIGGSILDRVD